MADADTRDAAQESRVSVRLLSDTASRDDFFGSHRRVANAIATVIDDNPDLKIVGLLGPWGSGKSTVVHLVEEKLRSSATDFRIFTYDAWIHQSDPPRRAFLERFLSFLASCALVDAEQWCEPMDLLNRRVETSETTTTPTLTSAGHWLLLSLAFVPFGTRFLGTDWFEKIDRTGLADPEHWAFLLGLLLSAAPLLVAAFLYYRWRPVRWPFRKAWLPFDRSFLSKSNWTQHRQPHESESLLAVIANKQVNRQNSRVTKTPEPTTIEFQSIFRDILATASRDNQRIVIVIDNLDRLPADDAVSMWATIRSFFLGAIPASEQPAPISLPTVLLPVDEHALARTVGVEDADLAKSFMDKTFDISFHVSGPVLSDWNAYLKHQMALAFGQDMADHWAFDVGRMIERLLPARVTPRDLIRTVNAIGALWLQWASTGHPFPSVAYYAINRAGFDSNLFMALNSPNFDLSEHDNDWQRSLASIHFGVPSENAIQILLEGPLREAIERRDHATFAKQVEINGFDRVLMRLIEHESMTLERLANLVELLDQAETPQKTWTARVWSKVQSRYRSTDLVSGAEDRAGLVLERLAKPLDGHRRDQLLNAVAGIINRLDGKALEARAARDGYRHLLISWVDLRNLHGGHSEPVTINEPAAYLEIAAQTLGDAGPSLLLRSSSSADQLASVFAKRLEDRQPMVNALAEACVVLHHRPGDKSQAALVALAGATLLGSNVQFHGIEAAVHLLGVMRPNRKDAKARVQELAANGTMTERAAEALKEERTDLAARLTALTILQEVVPGLPPSGDWTRYLQQHPAFLDTTGDCLAAYADDGFLEELSKLAKRVPSAKPLASALMVRRLDVLDLGILPVASVIDDVDPLADLLPEDRQIDFACEFAEYTGFWEGLEEAWPEGSSRRILDWLISAQNNDGEKRKRARALLRKFLKDTLSADRWHTEIVEDGDILKLAARLPNLERQPLALGAALYQALHDMLGELIDDADRFHGRRWFEAAAMLSADGRKTLLRNLRDRLNSKVDVPNLLELFKSGGNMLLAEGDFAERGDDTVRHILLPILAIDEGVMWAVENSPQIESWIRSSGASTQSFLGEQIRDRLDSATETTRPLLVNLQEDWKLGRG